MKLITFVIFRSDQIRSDQIRSSEFVEEYHIGHRQVVVVAIGNAFWACLLLGKHSGKEKSRGRGCSVPFRLPSRAIKKAASVDVHLPFSNCHPGLVCELKAFFLPGTYLQSEVK
jgi:hypothetical protein